MRDSLQLRSSAYHISPSAWLAPDDGKVRSTGSHIMTRPEEVAGAARGLQTR